LARVLYSKSTLLAATEQVGNESLFLSDYFEPRDKQMIIPFEQLSSEALQGLIEEFITREGTDYGIEEVSLNTKVEQVKHLLTRREVVVVFDFATESASLLTRRDAELIEQNRTAD
jgi:uncharacterized protein YheU (UPF0270 family)